MDQSGPHSPQIGGPLDVRREKLPDFLNDTLRQPDISSAPRVPGYENPFRDPAAAGHSFPTPLLLTRGVSLSAISEHSSGGDLQAEMRPAYRALRARSATTTAAAARSNRCHGAWSSFFLLSGFSYTLRLHLEVWRIRRDEG